MQCRRCLAEKPLEGFYANDRTCKECRCAMVRANRAKKVEQYREYDSARANRPDRVEARESYRKTEEGKAAVRRAHLGYHEREPERRAARVALGNAVRDGRVVPWPACSLPEGCEKTDVEAHHADYSNPLGVVWLCSTHHRQAHALFTRIVNKEARQ